MQWQDDYFDEFNVLQGQVPLYAIGRNDVDLKGQIDYQNNLFLSGLPAGWTITPIYQNAAMTVYILMDKDALMVILQAFAPSFVSDAVANQPPFFPMLVNPKETPRKTGWTDPAGVKRSPPPSEKKLTLEEADFSGVPGLLEAIAALPELAAQLTKQGKLRDAGIVLYAYNQVINNNWTITEAIDYLDKNGIL
jgi:hypothetical protein